MASPSKPLRMSVKPAASQTRRMLVRDLDRHEPIAPDTMRNRFRKQLTPPDKQLAWRDAVFARDLRCRPAGPRRLRHDPKLLVPAPAPPPLNRRDHFDCRHRAMPIVTISIA